MMDKFISRFLLRLSYFSPRSLIKKEVAAGQRSKGKQKEEPLLWLKSPSPQIQSGS